jgi:TonB-dependent SusC/RagA subfamily outer membrane receptor
VSSDRHFPRALMALTFVALSTQVACASRGGAGKTSPTLSPGLAAVRDTSSIANGPGKTIDNMFEGRFPGVTVARSDGGGLSIRIRGGANSFMGGSEPLYVVNDVPLPAGSGGIVFVNPYDIQKIEVLKNPADVAIYGLRGGNGVVKITLKKPGAP